MGGRSEPIHTEKGTGAGGERRKDVDFSRESTRRRVRLRFRAGTIAFEVEETRKEGRQSPHFLRGRGHEEDNEEENEEEIENERRKGVVAAAARSGSQWHLRRREQGRPVRRFAAKRNVSPGIAGRPRSVRRDVFFGRARYRKLRVQSPGGRVVPTARRPVDVGIGIGIVPVRLRPERVVARRDQE